MTGRALLLVALLATGALAGCGGAEARPEPAASPEEAARDAQVLGAELFVLVDRAAEYRTAQHGRAARAVSDLGIDSLTRGTARRLTGGDLGVEVAFRHPAGRGVARCRAGAEVLEDAALNSGRFTVTCSGPRGDSTYQVSRAPR